MCGWPTRAGPGTRSSATPRRRGPGGGRLRRSVGGAAGGRAVNPKQCHAQEEGTVVMGLGHSLFESLVYGDGQIQNPNLIDYRVPRMDDVPDELGSIPI